VGRRSETGGVRPAGDRIEVRFTWHGKELRPTLPLKPNAANLAHARRLRERQILPEIAAGTFDLARHFPDYKFRTKHQPAPAEGDRSFRKWCETWAALSARSLEHSTLAVYKRHLEAYWTSAWGDLMPRRITHEMVLARLAELATERVDEASGKVLPALSGKTQNNILIPLRGVFALIVKAGGSDPTAGVDNIELQDPEPDPFTAEEVEIILAEMRRLEGEDLADYFEFAFFAGPRASEQIALRWSDVDLRTHTVKIRRARVMAKDKENTKTNVKRMVELNLRAAAVIERQRARTALQPHGMVFATAGEPGKPWHDEQLQWKAWVRVLRKCGVRYRAPKEARDTSVTLALQAGADPYWVASQHGHNVTTMLKDYARWIPKADCGRNLAAVNQALGAGPDSAVKAQ